jgi:hypothetical protein
MPGCTIACFPTKVHCSIYSLVPWNEFYQVMSKMYVSVLVYSSIDRYILAMNWSVQVQTRSNWCILVCTCINRNMTLSQMFIPVYTGTVRHYVSVQKKYKEDLNTRSYAYGSQNLTLHYGGTHLDAGMLNNPFLSIYRYLQYLCTWCLMPYRRRRSRTSMLGTQHVAVQLPTLYTAGSLELEYMLLARPICELSVLEQ